MGYSTTLTPSSQWSFLSPLKSRYGQQLSLPFSVGKFLIHKKVSRLRFFHLKLFYSGDPGEGDAPIEDGAGEGQGQDGGQE